MSEMEWRDEANEKRRNGKDWLGKKNMTKFLKKPQFPILSPENFRMSPLPTILKSK